MKEFFIGGLLGLWILILCLSTASTTLTILAVAYPFFLLVCSINFYLGKKLLRKILRRAFLSKM
ncbi:MAG: hypothetical protein ACRC6X_08445 [Culicoidibacterales bacterium]